MFFKNSFIQFIRAGRHQKTVLLVSLMLFASICAFSEPSEIVDSIAALVNEEVITFSDLQMVEAFGLFETKAQSLSEVYMEILERMINQKLVIGLTRDMFPVEPEEVAAIVAKMVKAREPGEFEAILDRFGLEEEDVHEYISEMILYDRIIEDRFGLAVVVRLAEIERHYEEVYIPLQSSKGLEPLPLLDVLNEIEAAIKEERIETIVGEWISGLKSEADIRILIQRREKE